MKIKKEIEDMKAKIARLEKIVNLLLKYALEDARNKNKRDNLNMFKI